MQVFATVHAEHVVQRRLQECGRSVREHLLEHLVEAADHRDQILRHVDEAFQRLRHRGKGFQERFQLLDVALRMQQAEVLLQRLVGIVHLLQCFGGQVTFDLALEQHADRALEVLGHGDDHLQHLRLVVEGEFLTAGQIGRHRYRVQIAEHVVVVGSRHRELELTRLKGIGRDVLRQGGNVGCCGLKRHVRRLVVGLDEFRC